VLIQLDIAKIKCYNASKTVYKGGIYGTSKIEGFKTSREAIAC